LKTPLRWSGAMAVAASVIWAAAAPRPDVLIAGDGRGFALRGADGRLAVHYGGGDSFAVREWLAADADGRDVHDPSLGQGIACDPSGCIGKLANGAVVSYVLTPEAFEEDCVRAAIVVASRGEPPADCQATVIARSLWRQRGALALRRRGADLVVDSARPKNFDRPWSPAPALRQTPAGTLPDSSQGERANRGRDATPRQEDIEADQ
jgi:competence protein ComEC